LGKGEDCWRELRAVLVKSLHHVIGGKAGIERRMDNGRDIKRIKKIEGRERKGCL